MDWAEYAAAGLYDSDAPDAADRRALLEYLAGQGCSVEEMAAAERRGRLFALAGDRIIRPERDRFTLAEVAERLGADLENVRRVWRAFGLASDVAEAGVASPADVDALGTLLAMAEFVGLDAALGVARVVAAGMARIADAASATVRARVPGLAIETSGSELATATSFAQVAAVVPRIGALLDIVFRHHLEAARLQFEQSDSYDLLDEGGVRLGVGFADLSGFTGLSQRLPLGELSRLLAAFEQVATDVVVDHGGRLVKFIGDAVMFVCPRVTAVAEISVSLVEAAQRVGLNGRAGVAAGTLLALDGDYFGPPVNLAARLVAVAEPGTVIAPAELGERLRPGWLVEPMGPRVLRGFDAPVELARLSRAPDGGPAAPVAVR